MPPEITSNGGGDTASINVVNGTGNLTVTTVAASDPNTNDTITYTISGGTDSSKFSITNGALTVDGGQVNAGSTYIVEVKASDGNGGSDTQTLTVNVLTTADTSNPTLSSSSPADNATGVSKNGNISLTFSESVQGGSGNILIKKGSTIVETIDIKSDQVTFSGKIMTINPAFDFTDSTAYNIQVATTAVVDFSGNAYSGISDETTLNFTTGTTSDTTNPTLSSSTPADNATGVSKNGNIVLTFSENVVANTGNIVISDGTDTRTISITDGTQVTFSGSTITINPTLDLGASKAYNVKIDSTAIQDSTGNLYAGISDATTLNFETGATSDSTNPTLNSSTPADDATGISANSNIVLTFDENIVANTGNIVISNGAGDTRTISVTDTSQVTFNGTKMTINPTSDLLAGKTYNVQIATTAVKDAAGNLYAGISDTTTLNFATNSNVAPTISNLSDTLAYTEGDGASVIDQGTAAATADTDSNNYNTGTLTVSISANRVSGEDKLAIKNTGTATGEIGINGSNVTYEGTTIGTFTGGTSTNNLVITFNSDSATPAAVTALIKNITYENTNNDDPTANSRTVGFTLTDGDGGTSATSNATVTVSAGNDVPTISNLNGNTLAYTEGDGAIIIDQGTAATTADVDSDDFNTGTLTVSISANRVSAEDKLAIKNTGTNAGQIGIDGSNVTYGGTTIGTFTGGTGTNDLVITLNSTSATTTTVAALIKNITYENTNTDDPDTNSRTVGFTLTDGDGGTSTTSNTTVTVSAAATTTTTTTTKEVVLNLENTNPKTTNNPAAGAGKSDVNDNTISGISGNQGNDKDVGNAGGGRGQNTKLVLDVPDIKVDNTYDPAADEIAAAIENGASPAARG
ncbi:MAG: hypothetical protein HOK42_14105, partial [Candidatus Marinimicrobia bacterium]|nr:hypothetical protein [Candidatus Neomarinimicrobiota bacterium]